MVVVEGWWRDGGGMIEGWWRDGVINECSNHEVNTSNDEKSANFGA